MTQQEEQNTPEHPRERLGFIGLGDMGKLLARRFLRAGYPLTVCDINPRGRGVSRQRGRGRHAGRGCISGRDRLRLPARTRSQRTSTFGEQGIVHGTAIRIYVETSTMGYATMCGALQRPSRLATSR